MKWPTIERIERRTIGAGRGINCNQIVKLEDINPYYAAYLEHFPEPEDQKDNWLFIVWIHGMHSEFRRENKGVGGCPYDEQTEEKFLEFIRQS